MPPPPLSPERAKVAKFYSARSKTIPPLLWQTFALPFSGPKPGPKPGQCQKPVVLVLDNGPIHTSKATRAALATRDHWLSIEWLPKYAPELNDIETVWRDLKAHYLAHQTFTDTEVLDQAIHHAVDALNLERKPHPLANQRISA
jgi:hypothetical protein